MTWYRVGTVSVTNGSATVTGSGTAWNVNASLGEGITLPDGRIYEIVGIASDTSLTITPAYLGSTASGQSYAIAPLRGRIAQLLADTSSLLSTFATVRDGIGAGLLPDGSVGTPALRFSADQDTGLFRPGNNRLAFVTNGVQRLEVDASGNALFAGALRAPLGAVGTPSYTFTGDTNTGMWSPAADTLALSTNGAERVRVDASGNMLLGTATANGRLSVVGDQISIATGSGSGSLGLQLRGTALDAIPAAQVQGYIAIGDSTMGTAGDLLIAPRTNLTASIRFITGTTPAERMRIDSSGNLGVGTTAPWERLSLPFNSGIALGSNAFSFKIQRSSSGELITTFSDTYDALTARVDFTMRSGSASQNTPLSILGRGNVGIGTTSPNAAAQLDVTSTTRAFLPPRMTTAQRDAIASPPDGSVLYNSTIGALEVRQAGAWVNPTTAGIVNTPASLETDFQNEFYTSRRSARTFDQLIDFTRTSSATFVGSNGLIQSTPASRNLLTFTEEFDNAAWVKSSATVAANSVAAPDGTMTADTLTASGANGTALQTFTASAVPYTFSIWLRRLTGTGNVQLTVDGTTYATVTLTTAWARFETTLTPSAGSRTAGVRIVTSGDAVYAWGAQLELGSTATDYARNFGGLFPPRFDYDPVTLAPRGLLIEEQRTNLLLRSEEFDNASWFKDSAGTGIAPVVTANAAIAPDGTMSADRVDFNRGAGNGLGDSSTLVQSASVANSTQHAASIWIAAATSGDVGKQIALRTVGNSAFAVVTLTAEFQRVVRVETSTSTSGSFQIVSRGTITADNQVSVLIWGAQLEAGSFASSYIPTVAAQVTRTADVAAINAPNFAPWYRQDEGTFVAEFASPVGAAANNPRILTASDQTVNNRIRAFLGNTNTTVQVNSGNVLQATLNNTPTTLYGVVNKLALAVKASDFAASINGGAVATVASGTVPSGINRLDIGSDIVGQGSSQINGHIRSIRYYPVRLSNAQLQALTA
jgi:hypothetical protein